MSESMEGKAVGVEAVKHAPTPQTTTSADVAARTPAERNTMVAGQQMAGAAATLVRWQATGTKTLAGFEGFLKTAGRIAGVMLSEIVRYLMPLTQVVTTIDPMVAQALTAFTTSLELVQTAVLSAEQRWVDAGPAANAQKLADVLLTVEQPIVLLFGQAGLEVDAAYVLNLVNGVVALLNAQPGVLLTQLVSR